jgi:hypothetical protein
MLTWVDNEGYRKEGGIRASNKEGSEKSSSEKPKAAPYEGQDDLPLVRNPCKAYAKFDSGSS